MIITSSVVTNFIDSMVWMLTVSVKLGIVTGSNSIDYCNHWNKATIYKMKRKEMDLVKHQH